MTEDGSTLYAALAGHITAHDRDGALSASLSAARADVVSIPELYNLLCRMLAEVGAAWRAGTTEVWQEHFATAVVRTIVEACHPLVIERAADPNGKTVLLATPPDEYHDLGLRMVCDRFELEGWTTHLLGANLPAAQLSHAVTALGADAVVLSASTHFHRLALGSYVQDLRASHPSLRIWVGGAAFAIEADGWPPEMVLNPATIPSLAKLAG